ncbi:phage portal protein [Brevibacillus sp. MCWH]|jgi:SPP1 family phage portal protein|uniref:phage portal protein n=1 Tax=Brevibacillus sp. MCWH TaxID=2508871 RepID=UPI0014927593|nr:phage portal protein [Brevibacillus sp. MCWH]NNV01650.1 phage portal protein [Brevibacillus sp. MCWH]
MSIEQYIKDKYADVSDWFVQECNSYANQKRIMEVLDTKEYLDGKHRIIQRGNEVWNGNIYETRKIVLNYAKTLISFHANYLLTKGITITGDERAVKEFKRVHIKGKYDRINYDILNKVLKYGMAAEYVFLDIDKTIKSTIIDPADSYPVIDDENNYVAFIQHYSIDNVDYYTVYYPDTVQKYNNKGGQLRLIGKYSNLSGLPIIYLNSSETDENTGRSDVSEYISILDGMEDLLSKFSDSFYKHHNPIPVTIGQEIKGSGINPNLVGQGLQLDDGADFKMVTTELDTNSFQTVWKTLLQALLDVSQTPAVSMNKTDISNLSEVSVKLLFSLANIKASQNERIMREGIEKRFEQIRKLLAYQGITLRDDEFDSLSIVFTYATPQNAKETIDNLKTLNDMGAISLQSILEHSPYTTDVVQEMERLKENQRGYEGRK